MDQKVLVFKKSILKSLGEFQGFTLDVERYLPKILNPKNSFFIDRKTAETNNYYKQIISYVILRYKNSLFSYVRGKKSAEKRLIGMRSIALGGHIEQIDLRFSSSDRELYIKAAQREINEEVLINSSYYEHIVALVNDDSNEVSKVHFGILHIWDLFEPKVFKREGNITKASFITVRRLIDFYPELETWSQIALNVIEDPRIPPHSPSGA